MTTTDRCQWCNRASSQAQECQRVPCHRLGRSDSARACEWCAGPIQAGQLVVGSAHLWCAERDG